MNSQSLPLKTVENKAAPRRRLASAADAIHLFSTLVEANAERSRFNAKVKGMIDGNPPYDPDKLRAAGQSYRVNVNFLEGKAAMSSALAPYYDLFSGSSTYAQVRTSFGGPQLVNEREQWSQVITDEFDKLLKGYDGFDFNMQQMMFEMIGYGKGFITFPDKTSWHFRCMPQNRVFVPDGTDAYSGNLDVIAVRQSYRVHELWGFIKDNKNVSASVGWNVDQVLRAIADALPDSDKQAGQTTGVSYEAIQQRLRDRDLLEGVSSDVVEVVHILIREFDGKVSHHIVRKETSPNARRKMGIEAPREEFLFEQIGRFDKFSQFIMPFFLETLDGSWNGASGLGRDIFSTISVKDRLKCSALDLTFLRTGISLQAKSVQALQRTSMVQAGAFNIIPPDYEVHQSTILGDVEAPIMMDRAMEQMLSSNTGIYRQKVDKPEGNPRTAEEVRLQYQNQAVLGNSSVARFYLSMDKFYRELFTRAANPKLTGSCECDKQAKEFQKRCLERGVPAEALAQIEYVRAYRAAGNGSPSQRQQINQAMMQVYQLLPEDGKRSFLEDYVSSVAGFAMVERYLPSASKENLPSDHVAFANMENVAVKAGSAVIWTPSQNNYEHATTHLAAAATALASLEQGADKIEIAAFVTRILKHTEEHLGHMAQDPTRKDQVNMLGAKLAQMRNILTQLTGRIKAEMAEKAREDAKQESAKIQLEQQMGGNDPITALKIKKAQLEMEIREAQAELDMRIKARKAEQDLAIKDLQTSQSLSSMAANEQVKRTKQSKQKE